MPVAVLIFIILGALAVDHAIAFMGERALANASAAAANNAASAMGFDSFYGGSGVTIDPVRAREVAQRTVEGERLGLYDLTVSTTVEDDEVTVTVSGRVDTIFSRAIPGGAKNFTLSATSSALAEVPTSPISPATLVPPSP